MESLLLFLRGKALISLRGDSIQRGREEEEHIS